MKCYSAGNKYFTWSDNGTHCILGSSDLKLDGGRNLKFFYFSILTENVYWKLLKYKLTMLILTRNMQIFIELWYESLICVTRVAMWTNCYWKPDPIILLFFFKDIDQRPAIISFKYFIILTFSGEIFAWTWFCDPIFQAFCVGLIFQNLSSSENFNPHQYCWLVVYLL